MDEPRFYSFEDQLSILESRGMSISKNDKNKLKVIGYYKIKEFARPLAKKSEDSEYLYDYSGIDFSDVLKRYYQDKNLRIHLLHAIEKIEVALQTRVSYILGEKYGAFGYLDFSKWCNKRDFSKFEIEERQYFFKKNLLKSMKKSFIVDVKNPANSDSGGFPSVWLAVEVLTFGELVRLVEIMSLKNKNSLSKKFNCSHKELISWLKCLNFVRNTCAHNSNVIDLNLATKPQCKESWKEELYTINGENSRTPSNKAAIVILIIRHMVTTINPRYGWRSISKNVCRIVDNSEEKAHLIGFSNVQVVYNLFNK